MESGGWRGGRGWREGGGSDLQALVRLQWQRPLIAHVTVTLTRFSLLSQYPG